jgi:malate synthase
MEDMATGEIRLSILWEWLHKRAPFTDDDEETGARAGDSLTSALFARLLSEEHAKLLAADGRDVHDDSKLTTLPVAHEIVAGYVRAAAKPAWYIDLLNRSLGNDDVTVARERIAEYETAARQDGRRLTANPDFERAAG